MNATITPALAAKFDAILDTEHKAQDAKRFVRWAEMEPKQVPDWQYVGRKKLYARLRQELFDAIDALPAGEMKAYGEYRKQAMA